MENTVEKTENSSKINRRNFLKISGVTAAAGATAMAQMPEKALAKSAEKSIKDATIKELKDFPVKIDAGYKQFDQINTVFSQAVGGLHPTLGPLGRTFERYDVDDSKPGFTRLDWALHHGSWAIEHAATPGSKFGMPNQGWYGWQQKTKKERTSFLDLDYVYDTKHKFETKQEASAAIKRAARLFGAELIGITHHNKMWDYKNHYIAPAQKAIGWEEFPFKPKSVIVLGFEMDYESIATAPSYTLEGSIGEGYSRMAITAYQLSVFFKSLGYKAVAAGNDLGLSVPYGIQAGLGEAGRNGMLINYKYGPRIRIAKVYTDFDFVENDKPMQFGVQEFCKSCKRCADQCPAGAISTETEPSMTPPKDGERWFNNPGAEKWYVNCKSCFEYWCKGNNSCGSCITSCPYNKPDFWHHRLVDKIGSMMPGPVHDVMREMDIAFGYGNTMDEKAVKQFWSDKNREYLGY
jgi:epoxyqueuosine reductase